MHEVLHFPWYAYLLGLSIKSCHLTSRWSFVVKSPCKISVRFRNPWQFIHTRSHGKLFIFIIFLIVLCRGSCRMYQNFKNPTVGLWSFDRVPYCRTMVIRSCSLLSLFFFSGMSQLGIRFASLRLVDVRGIIHLFSGIERKLSNCFHNF